MAFDDLVFRVHAIQRMFARGISETEVRDVLESGEVIDEDPDDIPYPSYLVLGWCGARPLHVVASDDPVQKATVIVTVYDPDPGLWDESFRRRR